MLQQEYKCINYGKMAAQPQGKYCFFSFYIFFYFSN